MRITTRDYLATLATVGILILGGCVIAFRGIRDNTTLAIEVVAACSIVGVWLWAGRLCGPDTRK